MDKADAGELLSQCNGQDVKGQEVSTCPNHQGGGGRAGSSQIPALSWSWEAPTALEPCSHSTPAPAASASAVEEQTIEQELPVLLTPQECTKGERE